MKILLSNDDGVHARGIEVLHRELKKLGRVWMVAPLQEKSTTGHSLTIHKPLRLIEMGKDRYGVSGSPADCVYLGIREVLGFEPDLVVSGINRGANLGQDIYYSGTVSAAREACMLGIPAIAVSLKVDFRRAPKEEKIHYESAAKLCVQLIRKLAGKKKKIELPYHTLLNFNVPDLPLSKIQGIEVARQGFRLYSGTVVKRRDHRGKNYFWVGGQYKGFHNEPGTDCRLVEDRYASLSPLKLDTTDFEFMKKLKGRV